MLRAEGADAIATDFLRITVNATGMVDQGRGVSSSCAGVATGTCYYDVFFINVSDAASSLSAAIVVQ